MGEIADQLVDDMMDAYPSYPDPRPPRCRYCGKSRGLYWAPTKTLSGWFLREGDHAHVCPQSLGFEDLTRA